MISVGTSQKPLEAVEILSLSTASVHRPNGHSAPKQSVFPVVHTP